MQKKIRNAVRTFLIKDNQVLCIKYKKENVGYYDIPGGKIEDGETAVIAAIREFKEETGMEIDDLNKIGTIIVEYPDRIYNMELFVANKYKGFPQNFNENDSLWIDIQELLNKEKRYAVTYLLHSEFQKDFDEKIICKKFKVDMNHNVMNIEEI